VDLLDRLGIERAHLVGNSLGGRVALEVGMRSPERVRRLGLLAPSLAWRRDRPWAGVLRLVRPELGLVQLAPERVTEAVVRRLIPGSDDGWAAAGCDEFLRAYKTPRGRAAFYAAARQIYLEEPDGDDGFWPRLRTLEPKRCSCGASATGSCRSASRVHVSDAVPGARHRELDCGHVPQLERPRETHRALTEFFAE
jgi:pimeloyl-ACP methyl ester carboxylesterase